MNDIQYRAAVEKARTAAAHYYSGTESSLTDAEYDALIEAIAAFEQTSPADVIDHGLFTAVAAGVAVSGDVPHPTPMLSLEKVKTEDDIRKFLTRLTDINPDAMVSIQPKLDGLAIRAVYRDAKLVQVVTRGDGQAGEHVTARILRDNVFVDGMPQFIGTSAPVAFEVRGELVMSRDDFAVSNANRIAAGKGGFYAGVQRNRDVITRLIAHGVTSEVDESAGADVLAGMSVVVTGSTKGTKLGTS
jgi:DNA ligase (NAD+)